jgi:outer membrane protein OmpA-like peptidoglycan-associated protein
VEWDGADVDALFTTRQVGGGSAWKETAMRRVACLLLFTVAACTATGPTTAQKFIVFFQEWSAAIDAPAATAITSAAQYAKDHPGAEVSVIGYADPTGSATANEYMSHTRAQVVTDQLVADGVQRARINIAAQGATGFTQTSQESRRVEIAVSTTISGP